MKEYKLVILNDKPIINENKDLKRAEDVINEYVSKGWVLQQVTRYILDCLVGVFYRETEETVVDAAGEEENS